MADKETILARRNDLKAFMIKNRYNPLTFKDIRAFYNDISFKDKYGELSNSRVRADLNSIGIYPTEENLYSIDNEYNIDSVEVCLSAILNHFSLYRPILISKPLDISFDDDDVSDDFCLYSIILKRKPSTTKYDSKFTIEYLINNLDKFYEYTSINNDIIYFDIIKNARTVQFLFDDEDKMIDFYSNLVKWKKSLKFTLDFKKK